MRVRPWRTAAKTSSSTSMRLAGNRAADVQEVAFAFLKENGEGDRFPPRRAVYSGETPYGRQYTRGVPAGTSRMLQDCIFEQRPCCGRRPQRLSVRRGFVRASASREPLSGTRLALRIEQAAECVQVMAVHAHALPAGSRTHAAMA